MMTNSTAEAKKFLIERVLDQARLEGVALSDVEIGMLGFSDPPADARDREAAAAFERDYDDEQYEEKIAGLLKKVYERDTNAGLKPSWDRSLDALAEEDLYLMIMLEKAGIVKTTMSLKVPDWRLLWGLVPIAICIGLAVAVAVSSWSERLIPNSFLRLGICVLFLFAPLLLNRIGRRRSG